MEYTEPELCIRIPPAHYKLELLQKHVPTVVQGKISSTL